MRGTVVEALATGWVMEGADWVVCFLWLLGLNACSSGDPPDFFQRAAPAIRAWALNRLGRREVGLVECNGQEG